ncbi:MMPL family transporter [Paenarthrobacter aurescens]|jgi:RND superfamily putative drug exporter|uniref:Integral membrane protein, MMPL family n=1 Tax=Paenarthrobacter aurescens (strain TC1) TaxID=290340 RepID=A1RA06_PAEAT|nr:MMPL family transporter [Paenarthrobacter aurescens]ABM09766.1 putative integral membrane protein, MMPL family [Paenarthrobacter aurescens TC1]
MNIDMSNKTLNTVVVRRGLGRLGATLIASFWVALTIVGALGASDIEKTLGDVGWAPKGAQSELVANGLKDGFVGTGLTSLTAVVTDQKHSSQEPEFERRAAEVASFIGANLNLEVTSHIGYASAGNSRDEFVSKDGHTSLVQLGSSLDADTMADRVLGAQSKLDERFENQGLTVQLVGTQAFLTEMSTASMAGLGQAEMLAFPLIVIVLLLLYRSVAATLTSLVATGTTIMLTLGIVNWVGTHWFDMSEFTLNSVTMLGLGICVDYTLFIVRRFQTELQSGQSVDAALKTTMRTSGEAVLASGVTVALAMSALFLIDSAVIRSIATGVVVVVIMSMLAATILTPALLRLLGTKINWGKIRFPRRKIRAISTRANFATRLAMRRPWLVVVGSVAILGALIIPAAHIAVGSADASVARSGAPVRVGFERIADKFSVGATAPIQVLVDAEGVGVSHLQMAQISNLVTKIDSSNHVESVREPLSVFSALNPDNPLAATTESSLAALPERERQALGTMLSSDGERMLITVLPDGAATSEQARQALFDVRSAVSENKIDGASVNVGGETQMNEEATEVIAESLPVVVAIMLAIILLIMAIAFRSILIPLLTVGLNILSVGATFGILVIIFQNGIGTSMLGFTHLGHLINWVPVLLIALLVSLATDYQVFILTRIREYVRTPGTSIRDAVSLGLRDTGPLITGAAMLMVVVFGAFAFTGVVPIQQFGFGLAVGVAIDATIVRMLLVPACLSLLGKAAWWPGNRRTDGDELGLETNTAHMTERSHVGQ